MWDVTVSETLAQSYVHETSQTQAQQQRRQLKGKETSTKPIVLVCSNRGKNDGGHQQRRDVLSVRTWKAHHTKHR